MDPRITKLADVLVNFSTGARPGERLLVEAIGTDTLPLVEEVVRIAAEKGVFVHHNIHDHRVLRALLRAASEEQVADLAKHALAQMKDMDCYIGVRGPDNVAELADVPAQAMKWYNEHVVDPVHIKQRVRHTRWVVLRYPNSAMAQLAKMSLRAFEDFYFRVCTMDYAKLSEAMDALKEMLDGAESVEVKGEGTNLRLSVAGMKSIKCDGHLNIPDGELYTAPVRDSVEGSILFNAGSIFEGKVFGPIALTFESGKVVRVDAGSATRDVEAVLDRDEGARYVGEFAIGLNPFIAKPMLDTLFDEKIGGSLHMALGQSYDDCDNGNSSQIHWDLVHIQTPEYGGGELYFDGRLVRKDGRFVVPELAGLNPENFV